MFTEMRRENKKKARRRVESCGSWVRLLDSEELQAMQVFATQLTLARHDIDSLNDASQPFFSLLDLPALMPPTHV
jgi:hypothetical protein